MLRELIKAIEEFRKFQSDIQAQTIIFFLHVCASEDRGVTMRELRDVVGVASSTTTRNVVDILGPDGHDLLRVEIDAIDGRQRNVFLSAKGKRVYETLKNQI